MTKRVALSKHVTHYGSWTGFSFYNLTAPNAEGLLYLPYRDALGSSVSSPVNLHQYPDFNKLEYHRNKKLKVVT